MGNPRKPKALKLLQGTDKPYRDHDEAEYPPVTSTDPPHWLCDAEAVNEWRERIRQLTAAGVLASSDLSHLGYLCNMHARAVMKWNAGGEPTAAELTQMRVLGCEFGFTPASRSKPAKTGAEEGDNRFSKFDRSGS